jgi:hypothetical protein
MNDKKNPISGPALKIIAFTTFIYGASGLYFSHHINSKLPVSANNLSPKTIDGWLEVLRQLVSATTAMSVFFGFTFGCYLDVFSKI